jgi:hypothetical protein
MATQAGQLPVTAVHSSMWQAHYCMPRLVPWAAAASNSSGPPRGMSVYGNARWLAEWPQFYYCNSTHTPPAAPLTMKRPQTSPRLRRYVCRQSCCVALSTVFAGNVHYDRYSGRDSARAGPLDRTLGRKQGARGVLPGGSTTTWVLWQGLREPRPVLHFILLPGASVLMRKSRFQTLSTGKPPL